MRSVPTIPSAGRSGRSAISSGAPADAYRSLAFECFQKALPHVRGLNLRGKSLAMLGLAAYMRCYQGDEESRRFFANAPIISWLIQGHCRRRLALV